MIPEKDGRLGPEVAVDDTVHYVPDERGDMDEKRAAWGGNNNPVGVLEPDREYTVEKVEVHKWHTKIWLVEVGGPFNSTHFKAAP